ncbi:MAG: hypothetical protein DMG30_23730 [Acidobacteria bacterium]|nr:MAG: hypothetical protein DMG30_23730 [Acidobacteriota bacterium]
MRPSNLLLFVFLLFCAAATSGQQKRVSAPTPAAAKRPAAPAAGATRAIDTSRWKIYRSKKYEFEVKYPEAWIVNPGSGTGVDFIAIAKPYEAGEPHIAVTLAIQPNENPKKLSVKEWFAAQLRRLKATPESQGSVTIGGQPGMFMENTNNFGTQHDTFTLLHETDVLSFSYTRPGPFDPTCAAIVSSFRIVK